MEEKTEAKVTVREPLLPNLEMHREDNVKFRVHFLKTFIFWQKIFKETNKHLNLAKISFDFLSGLNVF